MQNKIKSIIEKELNAYSRSLGKKASFNQTSPYLLKNVRNFILRKGKRLRPFLFVAGYLGFAKRIAPNLYKSALSMELLHDFMLVHDDIVDKADTRRGKPSMHKMLGQDLAIIAGDFIYAMALDTFLSIRENRQRKEKALKEFIKATMVTATGEFVELLSGSKELKKISKEDIYRIYDCKTACYTFASPLSCGAILAGASQKQVNRLHKLGLCLGRAFQIKDDILGIFGEKSETGKSPLSDLQEGKKTILIWYAYRHSKEKTKSAIQKSLKKGRINRGDLLKMRKIIKESGALDYAKKEAANFAKQARSLLNSSSMRREYKTLIDQYSQKLLNL